MDVARIVLLPGSLVSKTRTLCRQCGESISMQAEWHAIATDQQCVLVIYTTTANDTTCTACNDVDLVDCTTLRSVGLSHRPTCKGTTAPQIIAAPRNVSMYKSFSQS